MINQLKPLLLQIARLPSVDQHWIMRQLSKAELNTFKQYNGLKQLQEARRFRTLKPNDVCLPIQKATLLPDVCQQLALKPPLYAAIILEQGSYSWRTLFLDQFDADGTIQSLLENQVMDVKSVVKQAVFNEWEQSVSFESLLDEAHG